MTPATDAAREARAREIAWKLVIGEKVGGGDGQTYVGRTPTVREIEAALLAFADTEAASQPREGEIRCPACHVKFRKIDDVDAHLAALTQRPPEQAGAVPAGWRLVPIAPTKEMLDSYAIGSPWSDLRRPWSAMLAAAPAPENYLPACKSCGAPAGKDCRTAQGLIPPCFGREGQSAAPTPPDAGPGEIPAGMVEDFKRLHEAARGCKFNLTPADGAIARLTLFVHENGDAIVAALSTPKTSAETSDGIVDQVAAIIDPDAFATYPFDPDRNDEFIAAVEAAADEALRKAADIIHTITALTPKAPPQTPPDAGIGSDGAGERKPPLRMEIIREWVGGERYARDYEYCDRAFREAADRVLALFATQPGDGGRS